MLLFHIFLGAFLLSLVSSEELASTQICFSAVYGAYRSITFAGPPGEEYWITLCRNPLKVGSIYASAKVHCKPEEIAPGAAVLEEYCEKYAFQPLLPMSDFSANLTNEIIAKMRVVENGEIPLTEIITTPILISKKFFDLSLKTIVVYAGEVRTRHAHGYAMYGIWGIILILGMLNNFCSWVIFRQLKRNRDDLEGNNAITHKNISGFLKPLRYMSSWIRTHLTIPSAFGSYHLRTLYGCDMPTRIDSIVIFSYWLIITILCCVNYELFAGNLYWPTTNIQLCRYVADRTGVLSFANLPLIWIFAGRNNIFLWATGWSFRTFSIFHRQASLATTLLAIAHSVAYTVLYFLEGGSAGYIAAYKEQWFYMGVVGTVSMSFLVIFSCLWFRRKTYEVFLLIHIALSVVTIVSMFSHISIFTGEYDPYLWPLVAIWGFDRTLRLVRIVYCNFRVQFAGKYLQYTKAEACYDRVSDIIRLEVIPGATGISQKPGRYYFIYQPFRWTGYESHPFTLGAWAESPESVKEQCAKSDSSSSSLNENNKGREIYTATEASGIQKSCNSRPKEVKYIFWIRPLNGWTRQLRQQCLKSGGTAVSKQFLLEGPYGETTPLWAFESVLFIVGGTGIAAAVPYIQDHIRRASSTGAGTCTKDITLIWSVRQASFIHQVASRELRSAFGREDFNASFHLTSRDKNTTPIVSFSACTEAITPLDTPSANVKTSDDSSQALPTELKYKVKYGRPSMKTVIINSAKSASMTSSKLAVLVCGPDALADEAREAVHYAMLQGYRQIEYIEDAYSW
ncbi:hypothetical protein McanMca71_000242 [Microsporum canis]|uniref:Ferric-chelate reductase n=1 Tax=Arthroderma otae (strain ATCC MYA-4605 / CBS 113480) TaxID=554155 RepID=C5FD59_ARTOC|nr:ferric-chelate reductase [Microsporum canis CBS 113480]EEQ27743.1 ferric-chelate reductase [Microsporum canis CBS 113480]